LTFRLITVPQHLNLINVNMTLIQRVLTNYRNRGSVSMISQIMSRALRGKARNSSLEKTN
ncbi:hypothetical protein T4B_15357, partial [Trichinella pseudospiralis]